MTLSISIPVDSLMKTPLSLLKLNSEFKISISEETFTLTPSHVEFITITSLIVILAESSMNIP